MINFLKISVIMLLSAVTVQAAIPNKEKYDEYFIVDLNKELPSYEELQKSYFDNHAVYDRKYKWHWAIGNIFDAVFRSIITEYGSSDKRLKAANEKMLTDMLELIPPEYYQYIGPFLHTVPTMSEKILNMPGIKETKNKFPTRIASQVADIEDLEFLSPYLYFLLMPEAWGENITPIEQPQIQQKPVKSVRNDKLYNAIKNLVPPEEFYPGATAKQGMDLSDLRTVDITEDSPLTSGDIKAFLKTIPELNKLQDNLEAMAKIYGAGALLDVWENEHGTGLPVNSFKDLVYPCRRLVQKMRIGGEENYLRHIAANEGFTPEEWAYTCDKTIRAYRMISLSHSTALSLKSYALGVYDDYIRDVLGDEKAEIQFFSMQAALRMHEVPKHDILEAYKNRKMLRDAFHEAKYSIIAAPIVISN